MFDWLFPGGKNAIYRQPESEVYNCTYIFTEVFYTTTILAVHRESYFYCSFLDTEMLNEKYTLNWPTITDLSLTEVPSIAFQITWDQIANTHKQDN